MALHLKDLIRKHGSLRKALKANEQQILHLTFTAQDARMILDDAMLNRAVAEIRVDELLRMMFEGHWVHDVDGLLGPPIAFNKDGRLANGSSRLLAQVKLGKPITYRVAIGVSQEMINLMDEVRRRDEDAKVRAFNEDPTIKGLTRDISTRSKQLTAVVKSLYNSLVHEKRPTLQDIVRIATFYKEALSWVLNNFGTSNVGGSAFRRTSVMSATVLAYQWAKTHGRLGAFRVAAMGIMRGENISGTGLVLRDYILNLRSAVGTKSKYADSQWVVLMKCLRAYQAILTDEPPVKSMDIAVDARKMRLWYFGRLPVTHAKRLGVGSTREVVKEVKRQARGKSALHLVKAMEVAA
jgi:hypothetical protein